MENFKVLLLSSYIVPFGTEVFVRCDFGHSPRYYYVRFKGRTVVGTFLFGSDKISPSPSFSPRLGSRFSSVFLLPYIIKTPLIYCVTLDYK